MPASGRTGAAQSITGTATLNARFPGQWFQVEAGLHYNWHRHYDPTLGRYTQRDTRGCCVGIQSAGIKVSRTTVDRALAVSV